VAIRIANLGKIASEIVSEISSWPLKTTENKEKPHQDTGGVRCIADILNQNNHGSMNRFYGRSQENNPALADQIKTENVRV
jgi:flagellar motor switch protein FliG